MIMSKKPTSELNKAYFTLKKRRNKYMKNKETEVLKQVGIIIDIVDSNYRLFSKLFKQEKRDYIKLTEIYNEESSFNGDLCVDSYSKLQLHLKEYKFKNKKQFDVYIFRINANDDDTYDDDDDIYDCDDDNDDKLSLTFTSPSDDSNKKTNIIKGFYTDTPVEIQEKFCKNIEPIYNELLANMSKRLKVDFRDKDN